MSSADFRYEKGVIRGQKCIGIGLDEINLARPPENALCSCVADYAKKSRNLERSVGIGYDTGL